MTSILGLTPFKAALAFEIFANIVSLPSLILHPEAALTFLTTSSSQITPAARSLTQWFGGVFAFLTVPLILSWAEPKTPNDAQAGFRRATYITMGAGEIVLGAILAWQYASGTSGLKEGAVLFLEGHLAVLLVMRYVFLYGKREWLEGSGTTGKKTL